MERSFGVDENIVVCSECFEDYALKEFITTCNSEAPCTYCGRIGAGTCTLEELLEHAMACIRREWGHPADEGLPYETREGGWQGEVIDSWELLERVELYALNDDLQEVISSALMDDEWCEVNPFSLKQDQTLYFGWKAFSKFVMHEARYVFLNATPADYDESQHDEMHPVQILGTLAGMIGEIGLLDTLEPKTDIYRVHIVDPNESLKSAERLGSPPRKYARFPNRMSPAGISMFYGAFNLETAILETYDPSKGSGRKAAFGVFSPVRRLNVLDLSKKLSIPSIFDGAKNKTRPLVKFLIEFLKDFTKPIAHDEYSHIDYVPTQVVTEYFRHIFRTEEGQKLDGIVYPSSKRNGQAAVVLFADNAQCVEISAVSHSNAMLVLRSFGETDPKNPRI